MIRMTLWSYTTLTDAAPEEFESLAQDCFSLRETAESE